MQDRLNRLLIWTEPAALIAAPLLLVLAVILQIEQTALLSLLILGLAMLPFFIRFERHRPRPRDMVPIVVLSVIAITGRALLTAVPNVQPVTAIVIISGIALGPQAGFLTGSLTALSSNLLLGQGPWTPWQMFAWGLAGWLAGQLSRSGLLRRPVAVYVYGILISFVYGALLNVWVVAGFVRPFNWAAALAVYLTSLPIDALHAASTLIFLILFYRTWLKKLDRLKMKYGLSRDLL